MRIKKQTNLKRVLLSIILMLGLVVSNLIADEVKFMSIGQLQNWFSSAGCEIETGRTGAVADQLDGFTYPSLFRDQDMQAQKGLWIGCKNYVDPLVGDAQVDNKVVHIGPREFNEGTQIMPQEFIMYGRHDHPAVFVDNVPASDLVYEDKDVEVDEELKADRMLYNVVNTSMGVTIKRKIHAYGQRGNDDYFIYEFILTNTGIYDEEGNKHNQTLEDVVMFLQYRWAPSLMGGAYASNWMPQSATWGHNTVNDVLHPTLGDDYRATYSFHGLHSKYDVGDLGSNNIGGPNNGNGDRPADGFLGASQFPGIVTIHADKAPGDPTDDDNQFKFAPYFGSDLSITQPPHDQFNVTKMASEYSYMTKDVSSQTHAFDLGFPHNPGPADAPFGYTSNADQHQEAGGGGVSQGIGYGPYTLAPGDSVRIVLAECVGSISWQKRMEVGDKFWNEKTPYILPDGSETSDPFEYKDAWVFSGKDSLLNAFDKAIETVENWETQGNIPLAPPPPSAFSVNSGGDRITLEWSNNAESDPNFAGYRIYRVEGIPDTTFSLLYECGEGTGNPITNVYEDKTPQRGFSYYYYITSFDNGQNHPDGKTLESSLFWTRTIEPAYLRRPAGDNLDDIRIVPNPVNLKAVEYQFGQHARDRLMFYNLPPKCTIRIYTERGDKIVTIHHKDGSGDEEWNMNTASRQGIVSGVYIAHIEAEEDKLDEHTGAVLVKKGDSVIKKFIVIK